MIGLLGKPLLPVDTMRLPDRPGVKLSLLDWIKFFFNFVPRLPNILISNRTSLTDRRLHSVRLNKITTSQSGFEHFVIYM